MFQAENRGKGLFLYASLTTSHLPVGLFITSRSRKCKHRWFQRKQPLKEATTQENRSLGSSAKARSSRTHISTSLHGGVENAKPRRGVSLFETPVSNWLCYAQVGGWLTGTSNSHVVNLTSESKRQPFKHLVEVFLGRQTELTRCGSGHQTEGKRWLQAPWGLGTQCSRISGCFSSWMKTFIQDSYLTNTPRGHWNVCSWIRAATESTVAPAHPRRLDT